MNTPIAFVLYALIGLGVTLFAVRRWPDRLLQQCALCGEKHKHSANVRGWPFVWVAWPAFVAGIALWEVVAGAQRFFEWFASPEESDDDGGAPPDD